MKTNCEKKNSNNSAKGLKGGVGVFLEEVGENITRVGIATGNTAYYISRSVQFRSVLKVAYISPHITFQVRCSSVQY